MKGDGWFNGERVQLAREFRGMTIAELAKKLGVTSYRVRLWESCDERPAFHERDRLAEILGFPYQFFLMKSPPPFKQMIFCGSGGCEVYDGPERTASPRKRKGPTETEEQ